MLKLTNDNYYSNEANMQYMSASQFKAFRKCEAAALAEITGTWKRPESTALLEGSYVDAYFSGEMKQFRKEHPEVFKRDGTLKSEFLRAHKAAERLAKDELTRLLLSGKHQVIKTVKIGGVWFKGKFDSLLSAAQVEVICKKFPEICKLVPFGGPMIVDLKYMRDFEPIWNEEEHEKISFIQHWGYHYQGAIYQAAEKHNAPFVIAGTTKETEPDIDAFCITDDTLAAALAEIEALAPRYDAIKRGKIPPERCGKCPYCRQTKKLEAIKMEAW